MDWQQNRLYIGAALLLVTGGIAAYLVQTRSGDTESSTVERPTLPSIDDDDVMALEITRPAPGDGGGTEQVRLERHDDVWHVTQPVEARADQSALQTALEKLRGLEVAGIAASHAEHHEELEVDDAHGVHVRVLGEGDEVIADLVIGAFRGGNTMVRTAGQDTVATVRGSIRFAFSRDLKDWRDRTMLDVQADQVRLAEWVGPNGTFRFARPEVAAEPPPPPPEGEEAPPAPEPTLGDWAPTEVSYLPAAPDADAGVAPAPAAPLTTIENFASSRVAQAISSLAHMRASDFAAADVTRQGAGITDASARVTLTTGTGDAAERHTVVVGSESPTSGSFYAMRDDDPTVYIVSRFLQEKVSPTAASFAQTPSAAAPPEDGPEMPGGPGGEIPPDLMRQIQAQLQAQGVGAH